jgi:hypothetical protein
VEAAWIFVSKSNCDTPSPIILKLDVQICERMHNIPTVSHIRIYQ